MIDKATTVPPEKIGKIAGRIDAVIMAEVSKALSASLAHILASNVIRLG
jgi:hypothetical protein